jgi:hypothetical protein
MPISQIRVEIDGKHITNVLAVDYGLEVAHDADGSPSDARPRLARIKITRKSDDSQLLGDWARSGAISSRARSASSPRMTPARCSPR